MGVLYPEAAQCAADGNVSLKTAGIWSLACLRNAVAIIANLAVTSRPAFLLPACYHLAQLPVATLALPRRLCGGTGC